MRSETDPHDLFKTPSELIVGDDESVDWIWPGFIAPGSLTLFVGREKAGKSTLVFGLMEAVSNGLEFIGQKCRSSGAVYLSEEGYRTIAEKLVRFNIARADNLRIMDRSGRFKLQRWPMIVQWCSIVAKENNLGLLIVDSLNFWGGLGPEEENDAGAVRTALQPLLDATSDGLAVMVVHHANKSDGDARGSTAIAASADIIARLGLDDKKKNRRVIRAIGRYQDTPDELLFDLEGSSFVYSGTRADVSAQARSDQVEKAIGSEWTSLDDLATAANVPKPRAAESVGQLLSQGIIELKGRGVRGDPFFYRRKSL